MADYNEPEPKENYDSHELSEEDKNYIQDLKIRMQQAQKELNKKDPKTREKTLKEMGDLLIEMRSLEKILFTPDIEQRVIKELEDAA